MLASISSSVAGPGRNLVGIASLHCLLASILAARTCTLGFDQSARPGNDCVANFLEFAVAPAVTPRRVTFNEKSDSRIVFAASHGLTLSGGSGLSL